MFLFFGDEGGDSATPSETLCTLKVKLSRDDFFKPQETAAILQRSLTKKLNQVALCQYHRGKQCPCEPSLFPLRFR